MKFFTTLILLLSFGIFSAPKAQDIFETDPDLLYTKGNELYSNGEYQQARPYFLQAIEGFLSNGDSLMWMKSSLDYGEMLVDIGSVEEGLEVFRMIENNQTRSTSDSIRIIAKNNLGWANRKLENYSLARDQYEAAIKLAEKSGDSLSIARISNNISYTYLYLDDYETALSYQRKAKEMYEKLGDTYRLSFVLNGIYLTLSNMGLDKKAEPYIRQSVEIREELNNAKLLDIAYHNLARNFDRLGKADSSIIYYQKSLELSRQLENPFDITQTLLNIGNIYQRSGDNENALLYYNEALGYNHITNRSASIAANLSLIAGIIALEGDYVTAESFLKEALSLLDASSSPSNLAEIYHELAALELSQNNLDEAQEYVHSALELGQEKQLRSVLSDSYALLGEIYSKKNELNTSLQSYKRSYDLRSKEMISASISSTIDLARAYHRVGSDSAFYFARQAFGSIDSLRTNVAGLTFRAGFFRDYARFYNEVASWFLTQRNSPEKAYELIESAKARVLMDELAVAEEKLFQNLDETTLIKKQQMAKQIDQLHRQINEAETSQEKIELKNQLKNLEFRYEGFLNEMRLMIPEWKQFKYPKPMSSSEVMDLLDKQTAILEYGFSGSKLIRFVLTEDHITATVIDSVESRSAKEFFNTEIKILRDHITNQNSTQLINLTSEILYQHLIPDDLFSKENNITQFVVIPDGSLSFLPFEVLFTGKEYLIEKFNVKYLPSASIYPLINSPHRITKNDLLAIAGSGIDVGDLGEKTSSQSNLASLPATLLEVDSIAVNFQNAKILKNENVTEASLKSHNLADYRFIHFATHGHIDEINPSQSGLILSRKMDVESLFGEDGFLNSSEISGLNLNSDLVTLSACNTGMGKIITGEGLLGLQRSFLSAGSSAVIVSLWNIFDQSTSLFMSEFYQQMLKYKQEDYGLWNQTLDWFGLYEHPIFDYKAKALKSAKLALIEHPYYNHPVHWAPFILIGK